MTGLIVTLSILLFFWLVGMISANLVLIYDETLSLYLRVLFLKFKITPREKKKPSLRKYTLKRYRRSLEKEAAKRKKKETRLDKKKAKKRSDEKKKVADTESKEKPKKSVKDIIELVGLISAALSGLIKSFGKHLKIKTVRLNITVATGDAAKTAVVYGTVCQSVAYIMELLYNLTGFTVKRNGEVTVIPNFTAESSTLDLKFVFKLRVWHVFAMVFSAGLAFLKKKLKK